MDQETVHIVAREGEESRVRAELEKLIEPTRAEAGCLRYELLVNKERPGDFVFVQEYVSDAAFQAHMDSKHVAGAIRACGSAPRARSRYPTLSSPRALK